MMPVSKIKFAVLSLLIGASAFQVGCTDREIAAGVAGAFIGAIIVDSTNTPPPPPRRPRSYRTEGRVCHVHQEWHCRNDQYGRPYNCAYYETDSCSGARYGRMSSITLDPAVVASKYSLSVEKSNLLIASLTAAQTATSDNEARAAIARIGLDISSLRSMATQAEPKVTQEMIDGMAKALDQDPSITAMMLNDVIETFREQEAARNKAETI